MFENSIRIKYIGTSPIDFSGKNTPFNGRVNPGEVIDVSQEVYEKDLKNHKDWELKTTDISRETKSKKLKEKEKE